MSAKQIDVTCPCCSARLSVDVLTSKVMRTEKPESLGGTDKWSAAQEKVRGRTQTGAEKLEKGLQDERSKSQRLDDLFKQAKEKLARPEEE